MKSYCQHCGLENKNLEDKFCCKGCGFAYQIINNLGLQNYYQTRLLNDKNKPLKPETTENIYEQIDFSEFAQTASKNSFTIDLMVEGLHCAACVWLIENVLQKQPLVKKARINMTSKRLHLEWFGDKKTGNNLVGLIFNLGYRLVPFDAEILREDEKKYDNNLLKALVVAGFAAGNIMLISIALWSNSSLRMGIATRSLLYWISAIIALPAIIYSGRIFVISAFKAIKAGRANMDVPIAVAIFLTSILSIFESITKGEHIYFDSVIMLIFFLLIGRYLDFSARRKAFSITSDLMTLAGTFATIILDGKYKIITSKDLQKDMILNVAMGERIAADGIIIQGEGEVDTSTITGEANPKKCKVGDEVFAGTLNVGNALQVKVIKASGETLLAKIAEMTSQIETSKSYYTKIADVVAKYYTPIVHLLAFFTFLIWYFIFPIGWHQSLLYAAAVLIVTCPCALALAVPVAQIIASGRLLKRGILIKNGEALEKLGKIDTVIFDKTGTLTIGKPQLVEVQYPKSNKNHELILRLAASLAVKSRHILSQALLLNFKGELLDLEVKEIAGMGLIAIYQGQEIRLGNARHCDIDYSIVQKNELPQIYFRYQNQISTFTFQDQLRSDAKKTLKNLGNYKKILLSGDKKSVVEAMAKELGFAKYYFEKTPDQKLEIIKKLQSENRIVLMVGDGVNDAPALVLADVSISPACAADITKNIADIIFQGELLQPILEIIHTAKKSNKIIKQNLAFSLFYNLLAVPFAMLGYIVPLFAALAMSSSSIVVVLNALRIRK